jgi:hypothetical protein
VAVQHAVVKASYGSEDAALISLSFGIVKPVVFGKNLWVLQLDALPLVAKFKDWAGVGKKVSSWKLLSSSSFLPSPLALSELQI